MTLYLAKIELDEDGYLKNNDDWDYSVAGALAKRMDWES
jgi:sulfur relay (sulfurtransferase) DsrC/TusE family protein